MTVKYSLTAKDVLASQLEAMVLAPNFRSERNHYRKQVRASFVTTLLFCAACGVAAYVLQQYDEDWLAIGYVVLFVLGLTCLAGVVRFSYERVVEETLLRQAQSGALDLMPGAYEMTCDEKGLRVVGPWSESWMDWKLVHGVTRGERFVIVMLRTGAYHAVPLGAVEGDFVGRVEGWRKRHESVGQ